MRIVIIGAGKSGSFLAEHLQRHHDVTVIEQREDRVSRLRSSAPNVNVVLGDACEPEVLETAGVQGADLLAAVTGDDEDNLVVAMLAKHYGIGSVYGRVNHPANEWLFDADWGVDVAVSSPAVLLGLLEKDIGVGDLITLLKLNAKGVAIEELTVPERAAMVGKSLADVDLPPNVTVMAILAADGSVQAARGNTPIVAGDQFLLLVDGALPEGRMRRAFGIGDPAAESD